MKRPALALTAALTTFTATGAAAESPLAYPPHSMANSLVRPLPVTPEGRRYQLHIHLPASFAKEPRRRYPVLYLTDAYWDFAPVAGAYGGLVYDKVLPEIIIVGLGYAGDNRTTTACAWPTCLPCR